LYKENYLKEFKTEEEKAEARHALGLYNKGDVVAMSLLTAEDGNPTNQQWMDAEIKQLRKGDKFFTPFTSFSSVFDNSGINLVTKFKETNTLITNQ
jgi:type II secretory pathway component PulF